MTIGIRHGDDGFAYADFFDGLGRPHRLQEAHAGEHSHLLLGRVDHGPRVTLGPEHVEALLPLLQHFAKTGELVYPDDHGDDRVHEPADLITYAEPANGRIRLDMRISGQPLETWHLTEAQARGIVLVLSIAIKGRAMTAQAAPAEDPRPFGDCVAIVKETDPPPRLTITGAIEVLRSRGTIVQPVEGLIPGLFDVAGRELTAGQVMDLAQRTGGPAVPMPIGADLAGSPDMAGYTVMVPCDACDATGAVTPDGGHGQNGNDTCKRCKGRKMIPADPYEGARMAAAARGEETSR